MTAAMIKLQDGTEINGVDATCEGCGEPLSNHKCAGTTTVTIGSSGYAHSKGHVRTPAAAKPTCPHCGGPLHHNIGASAVNADCLNRQYALDLGEITDPIGQRPPVLTLERMGVIAAWGAALATPPTYGNMESAAGGAGTYAGIRPKTGRKKKVVAAAPGAQIQDMAEDEEIAAAATDPGATPKKARKSRKPKVTKLGVGPNGATAESVDLEEAVFGAGTAAGGPDSDDIEEFDPMAGVEMDDAEDEGSAVVAQVAPAAQTEAPKLSAEERRAARQERRRAMLAGGK